jgi:hypothetical protein
VKRSLSLSLSLLAFAMGTVAWHSAEGQELAAPICELREQDPVSILTPSSYLFQINEVAVPRWRDYVAVQAPHPQVDRALGAFGFGVALANTYVAVETNDVQMVRNCSQEIQVFAQGLGLSEICKTNWGNHIRMAEQGEWAMLRSQVDSAILEVQTRLRAQKDEDLSVLVELGMWVRLFAVGTRVVLDMEDPPPAPELAYPCQMRLLDLAGKASGCLEKRPSCKMARELQDLFLAMGETCGEGKTPTIDHLNSFVERLEAALDSIARAKTSQAYRDA